LALKDFAKEEWPSTTKATTTTTSKTTTKSSSNTLTVGNGKSKNLMEQDSSKNSSHQIVNTTTEIKKSDESSIVTDDDNITPITDDETASSSVSRTGTDIDNHDTILGCIQASVISESNDQQQQQHQHDQTTTSAIENTIGTGCEIENEKKTSSTIVHDENGTSSVSNNAVTDDTLENTDTENHIVDKETVKRTVALLEVSNAEDLSVFATTNFTFPNSNSSTTDGRILSLSNEELIVHSAIVKTIEAFLVVLTHKTKAARPTELALEGIAMIIDYQYFHGRAGGIDDHTGSGRFTVAQAEKDKVTIPPPSLLHHVLQGISEISESYSEGVQTAVINTLTKIVTAPTCYVHEGSLLLAMRATFHVYLVTKSVTCKDSARNALLNMLRAVFIRMEAHEAFVVGGTNGIGEFGRRRHRQTSPKFETSVAPTTNGEGGNNNTTTNTTTNGSRIRTDSLDGGGTTPSPKSRSLAFTSQYHADAYFLFRSLCKISSKELQADTLDESERKGSILYALSASGTDPTEMNGKVLSLELLLAAMDVCGSAFTSGGRFLFLVQQYLSGSLLKNCVSNHTQVAFLSQRIFLVLVRMIYYSSNSVTQRCMCMLTLKTCILLPDLMFCNIQVYKFKDNLKQDIEVFITNVFFRVLESQNSTFKQKALVLESLRTICKDPTILTQIFLNYDCDFNAMNLYKDILHTLTKLGGKATSAPKSSFSQKEAEREFDLCLAALECLVNILKTFLRALNLPCGDESDDTDDIAGMRIRSILNLDQALALLPGNTNSSNGGDSIQSDSTHSVRLVPPAISTPQQQTIDALSQSNVTGQIVDAFDRKRNAEQNIEIGSVKFTLSLKSGLNFFVEHGFITLDAKEIALFFIANKDRLDKTQMGEALGREPFAAFVKNPENVEPDKGGVGFWFRILHYYSEALDFTHVRFDEAIRLFLSGFRLPGEAQKIDRIMEKFAERFTAQNPDVFPSSDTAFILAFSVIMLNTDLHNPSIKPERRMTVESFVRNNRGIGENGSDLPDEFLKGIFDRIKESPFSLKEDDAARERVGASKQIFDASIFFDGSTGLFGASAEERRRENFLKERDEMMAVTERLMKHRASKKTTSKTLSSGPSIANSVPPSEVVKPMFDVTWGPVLGILSQVLECSDDERSVAVCLNGFVFAVRLAANSSMSLARDTFTSSLAKFTFLGSLKEMKRKNVESIRSLLSIAIADGENLGESWGPVLQCISQLARLRLAGNGLDSDESFFMSDDSKRVRRDASKVSIFGQPYKDEATREAEENNAKAVLEAVQEVLIDKVFTSTTSLSAKSLAHFIQQIMIVSSGEIDGTSKSGITGVDTIKRGSNHPDGISIYMLQRLVDVADHNMSIRPRLVWTQVWELMAEFFVKNACHPNPKVSVFAIDSLKQLSLKFLDKPELSEFNFQSSFLRPFQVVMENKDSRPEIREMVLSCVDNIIRTKSQNLRSGWKILFSILGASAFDENDKIEKTGLTILQRLLDDHLNDVGSLVDKHVTEVTLKDMSSIDKRNRNANAEEFICLCKASLSFLKADNGGRYRPLGLTLRAFCHIAIYSDLIASGRVLPPLTTGQVCFVFFLKDQVISKLFSTFLHFYLYFS
jgi:brefeldin A-inhibited guanine nucleotide-exchange protein